MNPEREQQAPLEGKTSLASPPALENPVPTPSQEPAPQEREKPEPTRNGLEEANPALGTQTPKPSGGVRPGHRGRSKGGGRWQCSPDTRTRSRRRRKKYPLLLTLILIAVAALVCWAVFLQWQGGKQAGRQIDQGFSGRSDLPSGDDAWNYTQAEQAEKKAKLPAYNGSRDGVTLPLNSTQGLEKLSYQQLYEQCLPTTVSIGVENQDSTGSGSGVVLTQDGYILTCAHVVEDQESATVTIDGGEEYAAKLVGSDPQTDLALLKIDAAGLTPAQFGQSDELKVGDEVLAIGDPLGPRFHGTLTCGIVSAINRDVTLNGYAMTLIQTTAAINSGSSGGPLLNLYGQVVGINNMKMVSTATTVEGLGFAVPSATVQEIIQKLAEDGGISRPALGITCYGLEEKQAAKLQAPAGLVVTKVNPRSDCAVQGLRPGDVITAVDGKPFAAVEEFKEYLAGCTIGQTLTLTVQRPKVPPKEDKEPTADGSAAEEEPVEYESMGEITVKIMDQQDLN